MKTLKTILLLMIAVFTITPLQAQKLIKKELQTANERKDGFQYQWNKYTYLSGKDTLEAAFDMNNKRITPNGYKAGKGSWGVHYIGGGMFFVGSKNKDAFGQRLMSGYNVRGECIFPETTHTFLFYTGDGLFELFSSNELGKRVSGLYDYKGNCIIPESKGFLGFVIIDGFVFCDNYMANITAVYDMKGNCIVSEELGYSSIFYNEESELFGCEKKNSRGETVDYTYSKDGNYYAEGSYTSEGEDYRGEKFEKNKRRVPNRNNNTSAIASTSSGNSSSTSTTSNTESGLLYEGDYTEGPWTNPNTGYSQPAPMPNHHIKIYEDHIIIDMVSLPYQGKSINGEKMYVNSWSNITYYVDGFYNIRSTFPYGYSQFSKGNVVYDMNAPVQGGYDNNNNNSYGTTPQKHEHGTREVTETCPVCHSTGNCQTCLGRGWRTLTDNSTQQCPTCKGNKVCWKCNGTGKITKTVRY